MADFPRQPFCSKVHRRPFAVYFSLAVTTDATGKTSSRLAYIDWMRGLACVLMFQTHCYDSWLSPAARQSRFFIASQLGGTFPAPLFLFLAGVSFALVTEKLWKKNLRPSQIARTTIRRGAEIFAFGLLFRLQEYVIAWGWAPLSDLLRVDILNTIGLSMMLMGVLCWLVLSLQPKEGREGSGGRTRFFLVASAAGTALAISLLAPPLWTTLRPHWLPQANEDTIDGVPNVCPPPAWMFPVFPWTAFAFAGLACGFIFQSTWAREREVKTFGLAGAVGLGMVAAAHWLDLQPERLYASYDYWHTSPSFFIARLGMLLMILTSSYAWCKWGAGQLGFSPFIQLGQASLLVYWVHLEFVYGKLSILPKHSVSIRTASYGLLAIFLAMLILAFLRTHIKGRGTALAAWFRNPATAQ